MNNRMIMVGRTDRRIDRNTAGTAAGMIPSSLNLLLLALIDDIAGVQT